MSEFTTEVSESYTEYAISFTNSYGVARLCPKVWQSMAPPGEQIGTAIASYTDVARVEIVRRTVEVGRGDWEPTLIDVTVEDRDRIDLGDDPDGDNS